MVLYPYDIHFPQLFTPKIPQDREAELQTLRLQKEEVLAQVAKKDAMQAASPSLGQLIHAGFDAGLG